MAADTYLARIHEAWETGHILIMATPGEGPWAGQAIGCTTPRSQFRSHLPMVARAMAADPSFLPSVTRGIRRVLQAPVERMAAGAEPALMGDIVLLMACKHVLGAKVLKGSGLFDLAIRVDWDPGKPWHKRGMLSAQDARRLAPAGAVA